MNVRGERILVFGDSLSKHGSDSAPEVWNVDQGPNRGSTAPGDILASLLMSQGAQAARVDARVGRSAVNFYDREDFNTLLGNDQAWRPTKVVVMLGTNDIGRDATKELSAFAAIKQAFEHVGAEVWAVGPLTYNDQSLNAQAGSVVQTMHNVFGSRFIDGRPLSVQTGRTSDGVHFASADSAMQTALNIANALMSKSSGDLLGSLILGGLLAFGAYKLFEAFVHAPTGEALHRRDVLSGAFLGPADDGKPSIDELARRAKKLKHARESMIRDALAESPAIIITPKHGEPKLAIMSGEMQNKQHGSLRVTYFGHDGPIGHATRTSLKAIVDDINDYFPESVRPATEDEVIRWTGTDEFAEGAARVARVQRENAGLKGAKRRKKRA